MASLLYLLRSKWLEALKEWQDNHTQLGSARWYLPTKKNNPVEYFL